ncbi:RimJ/RimL family protein N-acetyltransferase [Prauserella shujinwangii]|uniref:RimJ/RimL family protein N-acetyltransferase n=1 Tax=Prauserella shujinwangii TaxID=1453103 RepID=A0A2T0M2Z6_9PSEU|nr:GNAT family N-acetyltransferase [Prauserella shujinwangii]PRX51123.1 RimJ/RimL family protein N-acetyltransferase [Prauserella shujinwangii]
MYRPRFPIGTDRLLLRPFRPDDLDALHALQSRPDVTRYLYWDPRSREETATALAKRMRCGAFEKGGDVLGLAVERADTGELIGDVHLEWVSERHRQGEIGFVFHPDHHGNGFASEAAVELLRMGFEGLGLRRIVGRCDGRNTRSAAVLRRLGMRQEAHLRQNEIVKGEWTDELVFAMLEDEWRARPVR